MILDSILEASVRFFSLVYKLFEQYVVNYLVNFGILLTHSFFQLSSYPIVVYSNKLRCEDHLSTKTIKL